MAANLVGMAFIPYYNDLVKILDTNEELRKTARGIFKQMAWGAAGAAAGGVVAGFIGAFVGTIIGAGLGLCFSSNYNSLVAVIRNLTDDEKKQIVRKVQALVGSSSRDALISFIGTKVNREALLKLLQKFANNVKARGR